MSRILTNAVLAMLVASLLGCATSKEALMPHGDGTMLDIWHQNTAGPLKSGQVARNLLEARQVLRRPLTQAKARTLDSINTSYTRAASNEIYSQFRRLPNPDLVMYVFPHVSGTDPVPIPGYSTVFPLYQRIHYAMPGERTEDY